MTRPASRRAAACLLTGLLAALLPMTAPLPARAAPGDRDALLVTIDRLTPGTLPSRGRLEVSGRITNRSRVTWSELNVYLLSSTEPMRTEAELRAAVESDPRTEVGERLVDEGLFGHAPDLAPGATTTYRLSVPVSALRVSGESGVYWLGVHVLGAEEGVGRLEGADGRARTFLPLVRGSGRVTSLALAMQLRARTARGPEGRLEDLEAWQETLTTQDGRLSRLLGLGRRAEDFPVTWVVDPSVLDSAASVARGNPPLSIAPSEPDPEEPPPTSSGTPPGGSEGQPGEEPSDGGGSAEGEGEGEERSPEAQEAQEWLDAFVELARGHEVLALPYGDLDVASAERRGYDGLLERARELSRAELEERAVDTEPVVLPESGFLPPEALERLDPAVPVVLSEAALPGATRPRVDVVDGPRLVLADTVGDGGPRPGPRRAALAVRQLVLARAAVHALGPQRAEPLVVLLPGRWNPGDRWRQARFFRELRQPWLNPIPLGSVVARAADGAPVRADSPRLRYPEEQELSEIPAANLDATRDLAAAGDALAGLLTRNDVVDQRLAEQGLLSSSLMVRRVPVRARVRAEQAVEYVEGLLGRIGIRGQSFVTMSSDTGSFPVTILNGLDEPVTVGLRAVVTGADTLTLGLPGPVELGPGQRRTVRIEARASEIGVHQVVLQPTNPDGVRTGSSTRFSVRTSNVGLVIWVVMAVGGALLAVAVLVRIARRVRERRATHGPLLGGTGR